MRPSINLIEDEIETTPHQSCTLRREEIRQIVEALLISSSEPLAIEKIKEIIETTHPIQTLELRALLADLQEEYQNTKRGFGLDNIAGGYLLRTLPEMRGHVELLHQNRRGEKLSKASLEVLAIIAFKQPITRAQVEAIRGVDCSGTLASLQDRGLIEVVGRLEAPGRPSQYGVTRQFLKHFGLKDIRDLN